MGTTKTADEARRHYIEHMGVPLGSLYSELWQEVAWLYVKWNEYVALYGRKDSRIELLNNAAPLFFRVVQDTFLEDTILHIARLTDPPRSAGEPNLTIRRLPTLFVDTKVANRISTLIEKADSATSFCRDWRNRHLAHRDLALALDSGAEPLAPASRKAIRNALDSVGEVLDTVSVHFLKTSIKFDMESNIGGAEVLLRVLDDGIRAAVERRRRVQSRNYTPDDFNRREI